MSTCFATVCLKGISKIVASHCKYRILIKICYTHYHHTENSDKLSGIQSVMSPDFCFRRLPHALTTTPYSSPFRCLHVSRLDSATPKAHPATMTLTDVSLHAHFSMALASPFIPNTFSLNTAVPP